MEKGWNIVFISENRSVIDILVSILDEEGIKSININKQDSSYQMFGDIEIYVQNENTEKAIEIINSFKRRDIHDQTNS